MIISKHSIAAPLLALSLGSIALLGAAAPAQTTEMHAAVVPGDAVKWGPAPPSLPPGAQAAVLFGHPGKPGPFVLRLKFPGGFIVPPHRHSKDELLTIISGNFAAAAGEKVDREAARPLPAGSFVHLPAGMPHYALAATETVVQINGMGPFDITYVNAKDDPRKK